MDDFNLEEDGALVEIETEKKREDAQAGKRMALGAIIISFFLFLGKISGYVLSMLIANWFGSKDKIASADAYYIIYKNLIYSTYTNLEKVLRPAYLPQFVREKHQHGEEQGWRLTSVIFNLELLFLLLLAVVLEIFAPQIIVWLWPNLAYNASICSIATLLMRVMLPTIIFLSLSLMPELTLHAYKRFTVPAVAEFLFRTMLVVGMVMGIFFIWNPDNPHAILAAAIGVVLGGLMRFLGMLPGLGKRLKNYRLIFDPRRVPGAMTVFALMPPILVGMFAAYARALADSIYANRIGVGMYSYLTWGRQMGDSTLQILPLAVSFVVYPFLSEWAAREEKDKLADALVSMTRIMSFIFVPISVGLMFLARPIITIMFEHGSMTSEGSALSATALYCYAPGLVFFALEGSINKWYFALQDTKTPNYWGAAMAVLNIGLVYVAVSVLFKGGHISAASALAAVALATSLTKSLKVIVLYGLIRKAVGKIDRRKALLFALKLAVATILMSIVIYFIGLTLQPALAAWQPPFAVKKLRMLGLAAAVGVGGGTVFLVSAALLKLEELTMIGSYLREKVRKRLGRG